VRLPSTAILLTSHHDRKINISLFLVFVVGHEMYK